MSALKDVFQDLTVLVLRVALRGVYDMAAELAREKCLLESSEENKSRESRE